MGASSWQLLLGTCATPPPLSEVQPLEAALPLFWLLCTAAEREREEGRERGETGEERGEVREQIEGKREGGRDSGSAARQWERRFYSKG